MFVKEKLAIVLLATILTVQLTHLILALRTPSNESQVIQVPIPTVDGSGASHTMMTINSPDPELLRASVREVVAEELRSYLIKQNSTTAAAAQIDAEDSQASLEAVTQANAVIDRAVSSGVWTDADNTALISYAPKLSQAQRYAVLDKLLSAVNNQQLEITGGPLPAL